MTRTFTDDSLMNWEVFPSGGRFGLPESPKVVFRCLSDPQRRARFVQHRGDDADAARAVIEFSDRQLNELLESSLTLE